MPEPGSPQSFNRYAYVSNRPLNYTDPSGHAPCGAACSGDWTNWRLQRGDDGYQGPWNPRQQAANRARAEQAASLVVDFTPGLGDVKGFAEAPTGEDLVTGESLGGWRWFGLVGLSELRPARYADEAFEFGAAIIKRADSWVARYGVQATMDAARQAAKNGDLVLPGLFRYGDPAMEAIEGYQKHHLWPQALGGPQDGWAIYVKSQNPNFHTGMGGIQSWLDRMLMAQTGLNLRDMRAWANANPDQLLPMLRQIYAGAGIDFPY